MIRVLTTTAALSLLLSSSATRSAGEVVTYPAPQGGYYCGIGSDEISDLYQIFASFEVDSKLGDAAELPPRNLPFQRQWTGPVIRAGTPHHVLFSMWSLPPEEGWPYEEPSDHPASKT